MNPLIALAFSPSPLKSVGHYCVNLINRHMREKQTEEVHETDRKISLRWKVLQVLGAILIGLGLLIDWPAPSETNLPDTSSFLVIVGALVGVAGLLLALRRE
ncbi:MAG: LPXTG cell wall anchor domain-containing protein [Nitrospira sp.]|nr:LPXTG cell wall anchor domain-containing protein [Nitrospira sp.]MDH5498936.1 LPXTG cell wall anchor domain-containing protein [Nitrospira sp.]